MNKETFEQKITEANNKHPNALPLSIESVTNTMHELETHLSHILPKNEWVGLTVHIRSIEKKVSGSLADLTMCVTASIQRTGDSWKLKEFGFDRARNSDSNFTVQGLHFKTEQIVKYASKSQHKRGVL